MSAKFIVRDMDPFVVILRKAITSFRKRIFSRENNLVYFVPSVDYPEDGAKLCLFYIDGDSSYWLFHNVSNILNSVFSSCTYVDITFVLWTPFRNIVILSDLILL